MAVLDRTLTNFTVQYSTFFPHQPIVIYPKDSTGKWLWNSASKLWEFYDRSSIEVSRAANSVEQVMRMSADLIQPTVNDIFGDFDDVFK